MRNRLQVCVCERGDAQQTTGMCVCDGGMRNRLQVCVCVGGDAQQTTGMCVCEGGCAADYRYVCV